MNRASHRHKQQRGATLVEMAFALPILLMLILAAVDFGLYMFNDLQLSHAAREAARKASVAQTETQWEAAEDVIQNVVLVPATHAVNTSPALPALNSFSTGDDVEVVATGHYTFISPFLPLEIDLVATAVMRKE